MRVHTESKKRAAVEAIEKIGWRAAGQKYSVGQGTLHRWRKQFGHVKTKEGQTMQSDKTNGTHPTKATHSERKVPRYSEELKRSAVARVMNGEKARDVAALLHASRASVDGWVRASRATTGAPIATKAAQGHADTVVRDAVLYLRHASAAIMRQVNSGKVKKLDDAQLLTLLALNVLEGGGT